VDRWWTVLEAYAALLCSELAYTASQLNMAVKQLSCALIPLHFGYLSCAAGVELYKLYSTSAEM